MTTPPPASPALPPLAEWTGPARYLPPPEPTVRPGGVRHYAGVTYGVVAGFRPLQLDVRVPAAATPPPLVVWIHGGAWMLGDRRELPETLRPDQLFDALTDAGLAVATIDYRHAGEAPFPAQLHDAKAAVRYLRGHAGLLGVDPTRFGVWGESAGAHLAVLVALTAGPVEAGVDRSGPDLEGDVGLVGPSSAVGAAVDWYGPADFATMPRREPPPPVAVMSPPELRAAPENVLLRGCDAIVRAAASPVTHAAAAGVAASAPPFLLVHGDADALVPFAQSQALAEALQRGGGRVELVRVEGADHIFLGCHDVDAVVDRSVAFLADALRDRNPDAPS